MRASSSGRHTREKLTTPEHDSGACKYVKCASEFAPQNHSAICGRGLPDQADDQEGSGETPALGSGAVLAHLLARPREAESDGRQ
jgi:hypothetical protein